MTGFGSRKLGCDISDLNRSGGKKVMHIHTNNRKTLPEFWKCNFTGDGS